MSLSDRHLNILEHVLRANGNRIVGRSLIKAYEKAGAEISYGSQDDPNDYTPKPPSRGHADISIGAYRFMVVPSKSLTILSQHKEAAQLLLIRHYGDLREAAKARKNIAIAEAEIA